MPNHSTNPLLRLVKATGYSMKGFRAALRHEQAFREEVMVLAAVVPLGLWLGETGFERALLIGSWMIVIIVELLNSAIEAVVDRIGQERHKLAGRAKDMGSAAVFVALVLAGTVWILILSGH